MDPIKLSPRTECQFSGNLSQMKLTGVINVETLFAKHGVPFTFADHFTKFLSIKDSFRLFFAFHEHCMLLSCLLKAVVVRRVTNFLFRNFR